MEIDDSEEQVKFDFPVAAVIACRANFEKSYLTQFWAKLSRSCAQIEAPTKKKKIYNVMQMCCKKKMRMMI